VLVALAMVAASSVLVAPALAAPAWAAGDDSFGLDERLQGLGFDGAYTLPEPLRAGDEAAVGMGVWYPSDAADEEAVLDEMDEMARTVWEHAGYRIARVVVQATDAPEWSEPGVPPGLLLDRPELAQRYGDRDPALDAEGLGDAEFWGGVAGDDGFLPFLVFGGIVALLALAIPFLVGGAVGGAIGYALGRRAADPWHARRGHPPPPSATPWTSPPQPPGRPPYEDQPPRGGQPRYGDRPPTR
jgi:hypothetical protein